MDGGSLYYAFDFNFNFARKKLEEIMFFSLFSSHAEEESENGGERVRNGTSSLPKRLRFRSAVVFNLRPSPTIEVIKHKLSRIKILVF